MLLVLFSASYKMPGGRLKIFRYFQTLYLNFSPTEDAQPYFCIFLKTVQAIQTVYTFWQTGMRACLQQITHIERTVRWEFPCQLCNAVPENSVEQLTVGLVWFCPPTVPAAEKIQTCWQTHGLRTPPSEPSAAAQQFFVICYSFKQHLNACIYPTRPPARAAAYSTAFEPAHS